MKRFIDKKLLELVKEGKYVPYRLPIKNPKYKVGSYYWCGYWHYMYKVVEYSSTTGYVTIEYYPSEDVVVQRTHCTALEPMRDFELRPFEANVYFPKIVNSKKSYTAAEIKALCAIGALGKYTSRRLEENCFNIDYPPKDNIYYYIEQNEYGVTRIKMVRDLEKSPRKEKK